MGTDSNHTQKTASGRTLQSFFAECLSFCVAFEEILQYSTAAEEFCFYFRIRRVSGNPTFRSYIVITHADMRQGQREEFHTEVGHIETLARPQFVCAEICRTLLHA